MPRRTSSSMYFTFCKEQKATSIAPWTIGYNWKKPTEVISQLTIYITTCKNLVSKGMIKFCMSSVLHSCKSFQLHSSWRKCAPFSTQEDLAVIQGCLCPDNGFVPAGTKPFFFVWKKHIVVKQESWLFWGAKTSSTWNSFCSLMEKFHLF